MESGLSSPSFRKEERSGRLPAVPTENIAQQDQKKSLPEEKSLSVKDQKGTKKRNQKGRGKERVSHYATLQKSFSSFPEGPFPVIYTHLIPLGCPKQKKTADPPLPKTLLCL